MTSFFHIYISPKNGVTREQVEEKLNKALDWFRYYANVYVVYTTSDVDTWMKRLKELAEPDGSLFICKLDVKTRNGWMTTDFWDWLQKDGRDQSAS
jgi:hypothetical protein